MPGRIQHLEAHEVPPGGARVILRAVDGIRTGAPGFRKLSSAAGAVNPTAGRKRGEGRTPAGEAGAPHVPHMGPDTRCRSKVGWLQNIVPTGPSRLIETINQGGRH